MIRRARPDYIGRTIQVCKRTGIAVAISIIFLLPGSGEKLSVAIEQDRPEPRLKYTGSVTEPTKIAKFEQDEYGYLIPVQVQTRLDDWEDYDKGEAAERAGGST